MHSGSRNADIDISMHWYIVLNKSILWAKVTKPLSEIRLGAWNLWGMGWKRFRWRQKELGNLQKCRLFQVPPLEFLQMNLPLGRQNLCYNKLTKKTGVCGPFSESTCNFWTITQRGGLASANSPCDFLLAPDKKPLTDHPSDFFLNLVSCEDIIIAKKQIPASRLGFSFLWFAMLHILYIYIHLFKLKGGKLSLSKKSHGSTCFPPDLPGGSFQTPAISIVGGGSGAPHGPQTCVQWNRLPAPQGWRQQRRLWQDGGHSSGRGVAELPKSPSRGRLAPLQKASYRWTVEGQMPSCQVSSMADALGNTQCRSMAPVWAASYNWRYDCQNGSFRVSSMADALGNTQGRSSAAFPKASYNWPWSGSLGGSYQVSSMADAVWKQTMQRHGSFSKS